VLATARECARVPFFHRRQNHSLGGGESLVQNKDRKTAQEKGNPQMKISDQTAAVVTGGASGLGEASARALASQGAKVAIFDMNEEAGQKVAAEIGGIFVKVDVSDQESVREGLEKARAAHGQERILINCAGIAIGEKTASRDRETGKVVPHSLARFAKTISVNLIGTFNMISQSAAGMMDAEPHNDSGGRGVIVNTASVAAVEGQIGQVAYASSKGGVVGMTLPVARDLARDGIRCCTILPGLFNTPMMAGLPQEVQDSLSAGVPHPSRLGTPAEYASLACHIIKNEMLNGECIRLDGALRMAPR
jgi:NAD(P)-dependent dehydrogenase (short-subunit alcohol dehydrogenase family)